MAELGNRARLAEIAGDRPTGALDLTPEQFEAEEFARVRFSLYMALVAEAIPRRLGRDATSDLLALDKRIARKVMNAYRVTWLRLACVSKNGATPPPEFSSRGERSELARRCDEGPRRAGASVQWGRWLPERIEEIGERKLVAATLALHEGLVRWGWRRVAILDMEQENMERIAQETALQLRRRNGGR